MGLFNVQFHNNISLMYVLSISSRFCVLFPPVYILSERHYRSKNLSQLESVIY